MPSWARSESDGGGAQTSASATARRRVAGPAADRSAPIMQESGCLGPRSCDSPASLGGVVDSLLFYRPRPGLGTFAFSARRDVKKSGRNGGGSIPAAGPDRGEDATRTPAGATRGAAGRGNTNRIGRCGTRDPQPLRRRIRTQTQRTQRTRIRNFPSGLVRMHGGLSARLRNSIFRSVRTRTTGSGDGYDAPICSFFVLSNSGLPRRRVCPASVQSALQIGKRGRDASLLRQVVPGHGTRRQCDCPALPPIFGLVYTRRSYEGRNMLLTAAPAEGTGIALCSFSFAD
jgi:hypothetical protein